MVDPKDKATDPKPAGKSGAVKPPVLEGTARPATKPEPDTAPKAVAGTQPGTPVASKPEIAKPDSAKPDLAKPQLDTPDTTKVEPAKSLPNKPEPLKAEAAKPQVAGSAAPKTESAPIRPAAKTSGSAGSAWLAGLVGGAVGLGGAYGLALMGYWPVQMPAPVVPPEDTRISEVSAAVPELQTVTSTLQDELATLTSRVSGLESSPAVATPAAEPAVSEQFTADLNALGARIDELAAAPQTAQSQVVEQAASIAALETELAALRQSAAQTQSGLDTVAGKVAGIETEISEGTAAEAGQARLPLIVSGLETAFATGSAYDAEIAAVRASLPQLVVPPTLLANAMTGMKRPDLIARDFNAALPEILAGRPADPNASWQDTTTDWFRGIIALRPTEAVDGTSPEAMVARLEGAISRGDFVAAKTELDALPQPMRAAAGGVVEDIEGQAAAQAFLGTLRQAALAGGNDA